MNVTQRRHLQWFSPTLGKPIEKQALTTEPPVDRPGDVGLKVAHTGAEGALCIAQKNPEMIGQKYEGEDLQARAVQFKCPGEPVPDDEIDLIVRQQEQALLKAPVGHQMDFVSKMPTLASVQLPFSDTLPK